ncbi:hypothetical protein JOM56_007377 [Amanita muscaria]
MTEQNLTKLGITCAGFLALKPKLEDHIAATTSIGQNKLWSSTNIYNQLHLLESLIPRVTEASARVWIDTFFFHASAMLPPEKCMVLNTEHIVPHTPIGLATVCGFVDYTAIVASETVAAIFLNNLHIWLLQMHAPSSFFIIEAKLSNPTTYVSQAICEMYACGRLLEKKVLHGAEPLTNGCDWIFLLIKFNDDYDGAVYKQ